ncbi:hypothetical protein OsI_28982 [Oryza sativa Indica Group]|uniref:Reverse transcriptase domain-containing protein n=1 Tax=Oryza sativa subsp. indica TaxID=39946 RepID=B8BA78_ORYSI|nr:hypothetical protein OsI_28982 [Oryza sativa Indica Group]
MRIGDFNIYRFPHEKNNDSINTRGMEEFNSWINGEGLFDIGIPSRKFTWSNKRRCPTSVKLDRVLIDTAWNQTFANASAKALIATTSDHIPILAEFSDNCSKSDIFRLENYWLQMPDFIAMTETNWSRGTRPLTAISKLNHKLRRLRASTKAWNRNKRSIPTLLSANKDTLEYLDKIEEWRQLTDLEYYLRQRIQKHCNELNDFITQKWKRRARIRFCTLGDENTRFYHTVASVSRQKNSIRLFIEDGVKFYDDSKKLDIVTSFFRQLFSEISPSDPTFTIPLLYPQQECLQSLCTPFTKEEIVKVIHIFQDLFDNNIDLSGVNQSYITLIPKVTAAAHIKDFRPISLLHSVPKLLSKTLTNRLQKEILKLIDPMQSGFIRGRSITENFILASELVQSALKGKKPMVVLKLDFHKAFDTVSWDALFRIMEARGFPDKWIGWIKALLCTGKAQITNNGQKGEQIQYKRGVRQGDPLSPYLFILVADVLQKMIQQAFSTGILKHPLDIEGAPPNLQIRR